MTECSIQPFTEWILTVAGLQDLQKVFSQSVSKVTKLISEGANEHTAVYFQLERLMKKTMKLTGDSLFIKLSNFRIPTPPSEINSRNLDDIRMQVTERLNIMKEKFKNCEKPTFLLNMVQDNLNEVLNPIPKTAGALIVEPAAANKEQ